MKKILVLLILAIISAASVSFAAVSSTDLTANPRNYDGQIVTYRGEVVGDIMKRKEGAWINVLDGERAVGVWVNDTPMISNISRAGSYFHKGDIVEVRGVFNAACGDHGGDTDIHADSISIVEKGRPIKHPVDPGKFKVIAVFAFTALILLAVYVRASKP